jgi:hypothetical protein
MSSVEQLPLALLLDDRGHLSELGASVVADGESALLPDELRDHLAACPTCAGLLGEAALLSFTAREVVRDARPASVATPSLPWAWIAPALALACASALPSAALSLAQGKSAFLSTLRVFLRGVRALAFALGHAAETGAWAPLALSSALVLVLAGIALGFVASRRSLSQGDFS